MYDNSYHNTLTPSPSYFLIQGETSKEGEVLADEGDLLLGIDESDKHMLFVYKWNEGEEGTLIAKTPVSVISLAN